MKNEKYWKKRQEEKLSSILDDAQVASEYVLDIYSKASLYTQSKINGIFEKYRDGHGLSNADAKEMLDSLLSDRDYNQIKRILENNPKTNQRKELLKKLDTPPYQYRIKRLENMQSQFDKLMNEVYKVEKDVSTDCYINSAFNAYYRNVYNLQKGMKVAYQFDMLDPELIGSMLKSRWSGKNYSNRIWDNTNALAESLKDEMLMGVLTNKTEKEMADTIMNKFAVGAYQARRLIQTESAAMTAFADQQAFKDAGIEKEMFIAVHDSRTSQICQQHDRSIVEIAKAKVGVNVPPLHPNCRSHMIPYIEGVTDTMKKRQRNPVTNKDEVVDVSENYDQWLKRQQEEHGVDTVNSFMKKTKNASSDRKQYNQYIDVLGKENVPSSLSKFQDMKYNDSDDWQLLKKYKKSRSLGKISAFSTFEDYKKYRTIIDQSVVGITTGDGIKIRAQSDHFIEGVLGTTVKEGKNKNVKREGVNIDDIINALSTKSVSTKRTNGGRSSKYVNDRVEVNINPDTRVLINVVRKEL